MSSFLRTHAFALCFAVLVGILAVLPSVLAPLALQEYQQEQRSKAQTHVCVKMKTS